MGQHERRREQLDFALELARVAEEAIMPHFRTAVAEYKGDGSEVTAADRSAERVIRERIAGAYPGAKILGEEFGGEARPVSGEQWVIDPIDGTTSFVLGLPMFGTLIALLEDSQPVVGVIHMPAMGETVYAGRGLGCWFAYSGGRAVRVRAAPEVELQAAFASATGAHCSDIQHQAAQTPYRLAALINTTKKFRFVGDCVQHALVCRGRLHLAVDTLMNPWDTAALVPCVREAGGVAATLEGKEDDVVFGGNFISVCSRALLHEALAVLSPVQK
ncbi:inositol monophosphatase family protein [Gloeobacter violaceus]|uniref:Glr0190 protein n=1 Tax=Gloeobacter violaceus (strain ATCC 29082 / PCC 7421) TaxID=251221 RepID=Q7NP67_GLOVI|nr:inositol monophosphatase family protein [Gloeobacter violaceus]BAC88131.1 glr0190 [Gloeobacter violaceus PCC 7421]